jgi:hypothetical protein
VTGIDPRISVPVQGAIEAKRIHADLAGNHLHGGRFAADPFVLSFEQTTHFRAETLLNPTLDSHFFLQGKSIRGTKASGSKRGETMFGREEWMRVRPGDKTSPAATIGIGESTDGAFEVEEQIESLREDVRGLEFLVFGLLETITLREVIGREELIADLQLAEKRLRMLNEPTGVISAVRRARELLAEPSPPDPDSPAEPSHKRQSKKP